MAQKKISQNNFSGGISDISSKSGINNSASFLQNIDVFDDPNHLINAEDSTKISSTTVTDLVRWIVDASPWNTNRYAVDESGDLYSIDNSNTVTNLQTTSGCSGEGLAVRDNYLYYAQATDLGRYGPLDGTPAFVDSYDDWSDITAIQQSGGGTGAADYVPPTSISEVATALQTISDIQHDPVVSITIDVDVVGTGNWTVTLHDENNTLIGSKTIVNGSMATGDVVFTFDSALRVEVGADYHFHVTSTVADGGVDTETATDLEGAEYTVTFGKLINAEFHPIIPFFDKLLIGNERYLAEYDYVSQEYNPNKIILPSGFKMRTLTKVGEYAIGTLWQGQNFRSAERAIRFSWDGIAPTLNFFEEIEAGSIDATISYRNDLVSIVGNHGAIYSGIETSQKITDKIPLLDKNSYIEIYPGAIAEYNERVLYGITTSSSSTLEKGLYEYGSQSSDFTNTVSFPYTVSTGTTTGSTLKIGAIAAFGTELYYAWRDGSSYGIDYVVKGAGIYSDTGAWQSRIFDGGDPDAFMQAIKVEIVFKPLTSGQTVTPIYKLDRASSFTTGDTVSTVGATRADVYINTICKEAQWGFNFDTTDELTKITVTGINFIYNDLSEEESSI